MHPQNIEAKWRELQRLEAIYGTGVRASWVGEEIGMTLGEIRHGLGDRYVEGKPFCEYFDSDGKLK